MVLTGCNAINGKCWTGNLSRANWPMFAVYANGQSSVTGDGTNYNVLFVNTTVDTASGWNGSNTYTIPAGYGGVWVFSLFINGNNMNGLSSVLLLLEKNSDFYCGQFVGSGYWDSSSYNVADTWVLPVAAGDTIKAYFQVSGIGSKAANVSGGLSVSGLAGVQIA